MVGAVGHRIHRQSVGLSAGDIDFVICTPIMWVETRGRSTGAGCRPFPNARYVFAQTEHDFWTEVTCSMPARG